MLFFVVTLALGVLAVLLAQKADIECLNTTPLAPQIGTRVAAKSGAAQPVAAARWATAG